MTPARPLPIVLFYPEIIAFGGEERVLLAIARYLFQQGLPFEIVVEHDRIGLQKYADFPIEIRELSPRGGALSKARALRRYVQPLIEARAPKPLLIGLQGAALGMLARLSGYGVRAADPPSLLQYPPGTNKLVASLRAIKDTLYLTLAGRGIRRADVCITNAKYLAAEFVERYGVTCQVVNPGGKDVPAQAARGHGGLNRGSFRILSVSRLEWNKRVDWIFDAAQRIQAMRPGDEVCIDIVGEGRDRAILEQRVREIGLQNVKFHGFVSDAALEDLYRGASVFVMPAVQGFGLPALEALYRRVPVVLHNESGAAEILKDCPWAACFSGGALELADALLLMRDKIESGGLNPGDLSGLPTETTMSAGIAALMGWTQRR